MLRFAVYAFLASGMEAMQAFGSGSAGPVVGRLLLALLDVAAGIVAIVWPGITALVLVPVVEAWAFVAGVFELSMAFQDGESAGERAFLGLAGLVSIALGIVLSIRPDIGALTLAQVYGLFSIVSGISILVLAANIGAVGRKPTSAAG